MTQKYLFGSTEWLAALHGLIVGHAAQVGREDPDLSYSMCEVYTDVPRHVSATGRVAWHYRVQGQTVDFSRTEADDVDWKVVCDYAGILPTGHFDTRGDPARQAELAALGHRLAESGKLRTIGDRERRPPSFRTLHDAIARMTQA